MLAAKKLLVLGAVAKASQTKNGLKDLEHVEEFVAGIINGLLVKDDLPELRQCGDDAQFDVAPKIDKMIEDFAKGDFIDGLDDVLYLIQDLPKDLKDCEAIQGDLKKIEDWSQAVLANPDQLWINLMHNLKKVNQDVSDIESEIKAQKYEKAGEDVADIAIQIMGEIKEYHIEDANEAEQLLVGLLKGLLQKDDLPAIQTCSEDASQKIEPQIKRIVQEIQKGGMGNIVSAVGDILALAKELPEDLQDCKAIQGDLKKISQWVSHQNPANIAMNVLTHWGSIQGDIKSVQTDFKSKKYEQGGEDIADLAIQVLGKIQGVEYGMSPVQVEQFLEGIFVGLLKKDDLPAIKECGDDATKKVAPQVIKIVNEVKKGDLQDLIAAASDIMKLAKELPVDLQDCKAVQGDLDKIKKWAESQSPQKVAMNIMANWSAVQADVKAVHTDLDANKYEKAGEDVADVALLAFGKIDYSLLDKDIDWELIKSQNNYLY